MSLPHLSLPFALGTALVLAGCSAAAGPGSGAPSPAAGAPPAMVELARSLAPSPDPRVGLGAGLFDAEEALWNLRMVSTTPPPDAFVGSVNSDLAFTGNHVIQGNYAGFMIWDISNPASPVLVRDFVCPASQSDVSVYRNLLFVSGEGREGRLDCGTEGVQQAVSPERLRGIRIFDIRDIRNPEYIGNVQTCRGSHTHTVLEHPGDAENVYIYVSGSAPVRPAEELPGCVALAPDDDPESALFRIEVIRVPLANPAAAEIVSSPRIFEGLVAPPVHGPSPADLAELEEARARGAFILDLTAIIGEMMILPDEVADNLLAQLIQARGGSGPPTAADSTALRERLPLMAQGMMGEGYDPDAGPNQCHDITVYPEIGLAGGACEGYGLLLDISDPVNPVRIAEVADENFAYWHSATFNNAGTAILFTDEWGGGGGAKCRADDPMEWGANAIYTIENGRMVFQSYYKLPAPQSDVENCVAHNGSLIPVPGRDIKAQSWYQGGISVFDWTDPAHPFEIAFHDRGPANPDAIISAGTWSVYWYNGVLVSSEMARGLDILELVPNPLLTQNEIDAAKTVQFEELNVQGQPRLRWPPSFPVARAYLDQLERSSGLAPSRITATRAALADAERASGGARSTALRSLATTLEAEVEASTDAGKVRKLVEVVRELAGA
jgi:hypothetical protein